MSNERVIYLPLGGAGEIGMNAYVYGYGRPGKEKLILVDLGVAFPDMDTSPGVDLIIPDISWLKARKKDLEAIFITHAHEDHVGAIAHCYAGLGVPVYARAFTGHITRRKLFERGHSQEAVKIVQPWPLMVEAGPFRVGFVPISHSIPESSGLVIDTPEGRLVHSGDFKIDTEPGVGEPFNHRLWEEIGKEGVLALMCDSTNIFSEHEGRSEATVGPEIEKLLAGAKGMVVATTFASNVARVKTLAEAGERAGRSICLMGRAMRSMIEAAVETRVLKKFPSTISAEEAKDLPREQLMLIVTGSQGEHRAASAQLAKGKYRGISLQEGDLFLFSSKTIPGNERGVIRIMNQLSEKGVDVVYDSNGRYHVSGHANRPDIERVHELIQPQLVIPMHGEHRHLREHVKICEAKRLRAMVVVNGMMVDLSAERPSVAEYVETGRTYIDGSVQVGALDGVVRDRIRMALRGHAMINIILDENHDSLGDPWCEIRGLPEKGVSGLPLQDVLEDDVGQALEHAARRLRADDDKLKEELRRITRQSAFGEIGKKPEVTIVISRIS